MHIRIHVRRAVDIAKRLFIQGLPSPVGNRKPRINPFYVILVLTGIAFALTACAMGVMMVRDARASHEIIPPTVSAGEQRFAELVDRYAVNAMLIELGILAVTTVGAIGTDRYWAGE